MQTINQPRTIRVTGCANCPYCSSITEDTNPARYHCDHNCFIGLHPIIESIYIENLINSNSYGGYFPDWCPLDIDHNSNIIIQSSNI